MYANYSNLLSQNSSKGEKKELLKINMVNNSEVS